MITDIAKAKSLIAWLREAISARDRLKSEINSFTEAQYCAMKGIELPIRPECEDALTEADYWGSMNIKARNTYYELETKCATLGQLIHPGGNYASQRDEAIKKTNAPHKIVGNGRDTNIYTYEDFINYNKLRFTPTVNNNKYTLSVYAILDLSLFF